MPRNHAASHLPRTVHTPLSTPPMPAAMTSWNSPPYGRPTSAPSRRAGLTKEIPRIMIDVGDIKSAEDSLGTSRLTRRCTRPLGVSGGALFYFRNKPPQSTSTGWDEGSRDAAKEGRHGSATTLFKTSRHPGASRRQRRRWPSSGVGRRFFLTRRPGIYMHSRPQFSGG